MAKAVESCPVAKGESDAPHRALDHLGVATGISIELKVEIVRFLQLWDNPYIPTVGTRTFTSPAGWWPRTIPIRGRTVSAVNGVSPMAERQTVMAHSWHGHFESKRVPEGVWMRCDGCQATLFRMEVERNYNVCPQCDHHFPVPTPTRIDQVLDADTFEEWYAQLRPCDPLEFNDRRPYLERVTAEQQRTGLTEAAVVGQGFIKGIRLVFGMTDSRFIMGSMGSVVGEKLTRAIEEATRQRLPVVIASGSGGGARMHEGIFSLMQMAKVSAALARHHEVGGLFVSVLTNPTMGGVAASFASLGDIILAEPKALIGFAGPKVIQQTVRVQLPDGFQTSEFLLDHGFIDRIVHRRDLRNTLAQILDYVSP